MVEPSEEIVRNPGSGLFLNAIRAARFVQLLLGPALIAVNAILLARYRILRNDCSPVNAALDCQIYRKAVGAFGYCVFPGGLGMLQGIWGMRATFVNPLPLHTVVALDNFVAGFFMGGGCTLAALINGWRCTDLCPVLYASIALFFFGVVLSYSMIPAWIHLRLHVKRHE
ncbi:uncharacterized protein RHO25_013001 [Cercospora beticola]|uniref:MARVEL domain-containing protein n=1 Tax=Cercospora beticola TaxID=122368 RepID=A0ABZ0P952_CERBT|nr:hypothetical protein RHO25_013001 [Cercospora beticola]CAK1367778.1 unnamed protein product [Cercospora beticola]